MHIQPESHNCFKVILSDGTTFELMEQNDGYGQSDLLVSYKNPDGDGDHSQQMAVQLLDLGTADYKTALTTNSVRLIGLS